MEKIALTAQFREKAGKGVARSLRRNQMTPAVLYSHGASMPIAMVSKEIMRIINTEGGEHALINLTLEGAKGAAERMALIKDYQVDPIKGGLIHVDLMEVAMNEKVKLSVAVHVRGAAAGVKEGGILQHGVRNLDVECLPHQIPDYLEVDISNLKINESLHVRDIKAPEGIKILTDADATVGDHSAAHLRRQARGHARCGSRCRDRRAGTGEEAQEGRRGCCGAGCRGQGSQGRCTQGSRRPRRPRKPKKQRPRSSGLTAVH